jgi:hypothetical protein
MDVLSLLLLDMVENMEIRQEDESNFCRKASSRLLDEICGGFSCRSDIKASCLKGWKFHT